MKLGWYRVIIVVTWSLWAGCGSGGASPYAGGQYFFVVFSYCKSVF